MFKRVLTIGLNEKFLKEEDVKIDEPLSGVEVIHNQNEGKNSFSNVIENYDDNIENSKTFIFNKSPQFTNFEKGYFAGIDDNLNFHIYDTKLNLYEVISIKV